MAVESESPELNVEDDDHNEEDETVNKEDEEEDYDEEEDEATTPITMVDGELMVKTTKDNKSGLANMNNKMDTLISTTITNEETTTVVKNLSPGAVDVVPSTTAPTKENTQKDINTALEKTSSFLKSVVENVLKSIGIDDKQSKDNLEANNTKGFMLNKALQTSPTSPPSMADDKPKDDSSRKEIATEKNESMTTDQSWCFSCGSLYTADTSDCQEFNRFDAFSSVFSLTEYFVPRSDPRQQVQCEEGEACLYYSWRLSASEKGLAVTCHLSPVTCHLTPDT